MHYKRVLWTIILLITVFLIYSIFHGDANYYYRQFIQANGDQNVILSQTDNGEQNLNQQQTVSNSQDDLRSLREKSSNKSKSSRNVHFIIGIISAPARQDRRQAIRQTWMATCKENPNIVCRFFTDTLSYMDRGLRPKITQEGSKYKDIEFMSIPRGINFGLRMLWLIDWAVGKYDFQFLLRLDDDYFVCLDRLIKELETRKERRLYWGYIHCYEKQVRVDEAFMILSKDIIHEIQKRRNDLFCSPFGDQSVAMWMKLMDHVTFFHDNRIIHNGLTVETPIDSKLCQSYIGIHHVYPKEMMAIWKKVKSEHKIPYNIPSIEPFDKLCKYSTLPFDWRSMDEEFRFKPDRCSNIPVWNDMKMWGGKKGGTHVHWSKKRIIVT